MTEISIGGVPPSASKVTRISLLVWGPPGIGKTTLAATMPGRIALINFDPDGPASIANYDNVTVFDFSGMATAQVIPKLKDKDPFGLSNALEHFDSVVVDSLTSITDHTLAHGIRETKGATLERPSPGAYGARGAVVLEFLRNILSVTAAHKKHICFLAHEDAPSKNDEGSVVGITMSLGGKIPGGVALKLNECWAMFETSKNEKMIIIRKARMRDPVKSRMFDSSESPEFEWYYNVNDPDDPDNMTIDKFYKDWEANGFKKLALPKTPKKGK
jgi:hypothetical protein